MLVELEFGAMKIDVGVILVLPNKSGSLLTFLLSWREARM